VGRRGNRALPVAAVRAGYARGMAHSGDPGGYAGSTLRGLTEAHSIDPVPDSERRGSVGRQGLFWFAFNLQPVSLALGFVGPAMGLSLTWTVIASVAGLLLGTIFVAFHAIQGPRLGLPQMIQSRAQFGYRGVLIPLFATAFTFLGYNIVNISIAKEGMRTLYGFDPAVVAVVITAVGMVAAVFGHDLLHRAFRVAFWLSLPLWAALSAGLLLGRVHHAPYVAGGFTALAFASQFAVTASYAISGAPFVSDYTRYLSRDTHSTSMIAAVFIGTVASPIWLIPVGAWMALRLRTSDALAGIATAGNDTLPLLGDALVIVSIAVFAVMIGANTYSGVLTVVTAADSLRSVTPTRRLRVVTTVGFTAVSLLLGLVLSDSTTTIDALLIIMLYLLVPWTAVNLTDYFLIRRGQYDIAALYTPDGEYGTWSTQGLIAYFAGIAAELPFAVLPFYVGPAARALGRVDVAFVVGLAVSASLYVAMTRVARPR